MAKRKATSSETPPLIIGCDRLFPIVVVMDRYNGLYSGGLWFAVAMADTPYNALDPDPTRVSFCIEEGPNGTDEEATAFWGNPPPWIAIGESPTAAMENLCAASRSRLTPP